ncbi:hypothetical protein F6447_13080 (plasmid) [Enterococcus faecium]|nr:hypothetical protein [Enterococcus faecium]QIS84837.1 hypothetical protein F6447_13080 [Enterococcus faecium]
MPMILRPGAVTKEQIEAVIESPVAIDQHLVKEIETQKAPWVQNTNLYLIDRIIAGQSIAV